MRHYLGAGAGLATGPDQVRGVGQVDEQFLLRQHSRSRKIQQENLKRESERSSEWPEPERFSDQSELNWTQNLEQDHKNLWQD